MPAIRLQEITTLEELNLLRGEWSALWERCSDATPFQAPEWLLPWWSHLFGGGQMWTIALWRGECLAGFAPLFIYGCGDQPRTVASIGSGVTDYLGFLIDDPEALPIVWSHIGRNASC